MGNTLTFRMIVTHLLIVSMLVLSSQAEEQARALIEEDRFSPQFVLDLLIGALIPDKPTPTTTTTPGAPGPVIGAIGGIIGLPGAIIGGVLPGQPSTTTTTTTSTSTTTPTTTRCGGLIGGGLLGC